MRCTSWVTSARGVAVVDPRVSDAELARLAARRVCGLRVNFVSPQSWGITTTAQMLSTLAGKVARHADCVGWHIQVFAHPEQIVALAPVLQAHCRCRWSSTTWGASTRPKGHRPKPLACCAACWTAATPGSSSRAPTCVLTVRGPSYADTLPLGQALVRAAPSHLVWGSDWPHTTEAPGTVNDADLVDLLRAWAGSDAAMDRILVDNPARLYGFGATS